MAVRQALGTQSTLWTVLEEYEDRMDEESWHFGDIRNMPTSPPLLDLANRGQPAVYKEYLEACKNPAHRDEGEDEEDDPECTCIDRIDGAVPRALVLIHKALTKPARVRAYLETPTVQGCSENQVGLFLRASDRVFSQALAECKISLGGRRYNRKKCVHISIWNAACVQHVCYALF